MANIFKNDEQRQNWNKYNNNYAKQNYRSYCIKLNKKTDKDIIELIETSNETATQVIRGLLKAKISGNEKGKLAFEEKESKPICLSEKQNNNLKKIRKQHGITQTELAEALGVTKQGLSFNETGHVSRKLAEAVAKYFNISVLEVMGFDAFEYMPTNEEERQYLIALLNQLEF